MASYIPNITDVFPEPVLYTPDFNRVERMLQQREGMYKQGAQRVKNLYESVFNSSMLRDEDIQRRDAYLKAIDEGLKNVSALDLSLPQNQEIATKLFEPVTTDQSIVKDIQFTRQYQSQVAKAEQLKSSQDPATRRQYWDTGRKLLDYQAEEFKNASSQDALRASSPSYVPNVDLFTLAEKMYKESGISVKKDQMSGGYIWTQKNGELAVPLTQSMVSTLFDNDPAIKDMLNAQAYVQRKDFVKNNAARYGSEQAAEQVYIKDVMTTVNSGLQAQLQIDSQDLKVLRGKKESWEKLISTKGIIPGSKEHFDYLSDMQRIDLLDKSIVSARDRVAKQSTLDLNNINDLRSAADGAVSQFGYNGISNKIAKYLAYKNSDISAKADPVAMAQLNSSLALRNALSTLKARHGYTMKEIAERGKYKDSKDKDDFSDTDPILDNLFNNGFNNPNIENSPDNLQDTPSDAPAQSSSSSGGNEIFPN
jgi:hypothetical protein